MVPELRRDFNRRFTPAKYSRFLAELEARAGAEIHFRNAETPCFFPRPLIDKMARYGRELLAQLGTPEYLAASAASIPAEYNVPGESSHPLFVQADFGIDASGEPKLVEIQGFPSLYAYQPVLAQTYRDVYGLAPDLRSVLIDGDYAALLRNAILGDCDPENVILMEVEPYQQKTLPDFLLTEKQYGAKIVSLTDIRKQGNRLFYGDDVPIHRIYNRVIVDELVRKKIQPPFDFRDHLDVQWAGHPNWYFRISKFSIPYLRHECVPKTWFLNQLREPPEDLDRYVLKPLYSFAGLGVIIGPTREQVAAANPDNFILQEKIDFAPVIETPCGPTKAEVRIMYVWIDQPEAVTTIVRMGRGAMMGVDHNRDLEWVGASAGFVAD
ncbi:MAG: hypothetical protein ABSB86_09565 [Bryobacteraceae bacterium]|jgi:hypothetical protein